MKERLFEITETCAEEIKAAYIEKNRMDYEAFALRWATDHLYSGADQLNDLRKGK